MALIIKNIAYQLDIVPNQDGCAVLVTLADGTLLDQCSPHTISAIHRAVDGQLQPVRDAGFDVQLDEPGKYFLGAMIPCATAEDLALLLPERASHAEVSIKGTRPPHVQNRTEVSSQPFTLFLQQAPDGVKINFVPEETVDLASLSRHMRQALSQNVGDVRQHLAQEGWPSHVIPTNGYGPAAYTTVMVDYATLHKQHGLPGIADMLVDLGYDIRVPQ